jgi:C4-dicarboxylate-binding protein DctP
MISVLCIGLSSSGYAQKFSMKLAVISQNDPLHEFINEYKRRIESRTGGAIQAQVFPGSQLGPAPSLIEGVQLGTVEMLVLPPGFLKGIDAGFQAADAPGLFRDFDHAHQSVTDATFRDQFLKQGEGKGVLGVSVWIYGPTHYASTSPLRSLNDFRGKKFRVLASDVEIQLMNAIGATGVPMAFPEVLPALQRRQIDGVRSNWVVLAATKFFTTARYITLVGDAYIPCVAFVSTAFLNKLPPQHRDAVVIVGQEMEAHMLELAKQADARTNKAWTTGGGEVIRLSVADQQQFMSTARDIGDRTLGGDPQVKQLYSALKQIAAKKQ